jgi:hypothetical protein
MISGVSKIRVKSMKVGDSILLDTGSVVTRTSASTVIVFSKMSHGVSYRTGPIDDWWNVEGFPEHGPVPYAKVKK